MTPLVSSRKKEKKEFQDEKLPETSGETELMHIESLKSPESYPHKDVCCLFRNSKRGFSALKKMLTV